jgi:hypothetical protein
MVGCGELRARIRHEKVRDQCAMKFDCEYAKSFGQFGLLLAAAVLSLFGCGPRSDRLSVSGTVTLDGAPLDGGSITFTSMGGQKTLATGAVVENGEYHIPQEKGLRPGTYHVEINAPDDNAPPVMVRGTPGGPAIPVAPDRIPAEYNVNSKKTVEITPQGDNHFEFDIKRSTAK